MRPPTFAVGRPNDERQFLHKKLFGGISKIAGILPIPGAGIISTVAGALSGGAPRTTIPTTFPPRKQFSAVVPGRQAGGPCLPGTVPDPQGRGFCVAPTSPFGSRTLGGGAVEGRYGPAAVPGSRITDVATCDRGMVLGKDGLCYANLANRNRLYPRGRRALLTGGDMRAISRARRAGNRLANAKSDLVAIGMLKSASPRRRKKKTATVC